MADPKHEIDKIREYEAKGYTASYQIRNGKLVDLTTDKSYSPSQVKIVDQYRYEGISNPEDMSLLQVIETEDGGKGTILIPFGPNGGDVEMTNFLKNI